MRDQARLQADKERSARALVCELRDEITGWDAEEDREHRQRQKRNRDDERRRERELEESAHGPGRKPALRRASLPSAPRSVSR